MEKNDLKDILEEGARGVKVSGETAHLKTPEQRKAEAEIEVWKTKVNEDYKPLPQFRIPHDLINVVRNAEGYHGLIFLGEGGIGKTMLTISSIKATLGAGEWEYSNGYTTPLALYEFLYQNRNKKVIILDDVEGIFDNKLSLSILKGALWDSDGKRICQYCSKSDKANFPQKFIMNAKIIILCNHIPKSEDASTKAMMSRTIHYNIGFTFEEKMTISKNFVWEDTALHKDDKLRVIKILDEEVSECVKDFNFRTLRKIISFVKYDPKKAVELFRATTEIDELKEAYFECIKKSPIVKVQIAYFMDRTGMSRRTFFRIKKEESVKVSKKTNADTYTE